MVAMSGGVDSSVAAALLLEAGHDVVGVTLKLWGGESDTGCCSISDTDDARRVADRLGIEHHTFNFGDDFDAHVVQPYVAAHAVGSDPEPVHRVQSPPQVRSSRPTGPTPWASTRSPRGTTPGWSSSGDGTTRRVARGVDSGKDQSYVLAMLGQERLRSLLLPVGEMTKDEVRHRAAELGLRTADKPDSQDVCFITSTSRREGFLKKRIPLTPGAWSTPMATRSGGWMPSSCSRSASAADSTCPVAPAPATSSAPTSDRPR